MSDLSSHIVELIKSSINRELSFDVINEIVKSDNFKSAQYLCLIKQIEGFVLDVIHTHSSKFDRNKGAELELTELKRMLNYKDLRSVMNWCDKNDVFVMLQGNLQFVNKHEFLLAFYKPFITKLRLKHENWKEVFVDYLKGNLTNLLTDPSKPKYVKSNYRPNNNTEKSFLNKIKDL